MGSLNQATAYESPAHSSTGTRSSVESDFHCLWANGFMFYFTPLIGVLFTFPSRYWFAIGHTVVFSLTRWSSLIHMGFHVPHATRDTATILKFSTTGLSPSLVQFFAASSNRQIRYRCPTTPKSKLFGLGFSPFAHHYLENLVLISFPPATKMFQFAGLAQTCLYIQQAVLGVPPFGYLRIDCLLPAPRSVSSVTTSFFASVCLGIHH